MPHSSSHLLLITAPATGCFHEHHHLKCGAVALNWSKSYKYASTFVSAAARVGNSKSSSRCLIRCDYQLADLAPATSATYGLLLLGGGLFAYTKSGSKGSLFGGLTGVALMASAYFLMEVLHTKAIGDAVGFGSSFLFSSVFAIRLAATRIQSSTSHIESQGEVT